MCDVYSRGVQLTPRYPCRRVYFNLSEPGPSHRETAPLRSDLPSDLPGQTPGKTPRPKSLSESLLLSLEPNRESRYMKQIRRDTMVTWHRKGPELRPLAGAAADRQSRPGISTSGRLKHPHGTCNRGTVQSCGASPSSLSILKQFRLQPVGSDFTLPYPTTPPELHEFAPSPSAITTAHDQMAFSCTLEPFSRLVNIDCAGPTKEPRQLTDLLGLNAAIAPTS